MNVKKRKKNIQEWEPVLYSCDFITPPPSWNLHAYLLWSLSYGYVSVCAQQCALKVHFTFELSAIKYHDFILLNICVKFDFLTCGQRPDLSDHTDLDLQPPRDEEKYSKMSLFNSSHKKNTSEIGEPSLRHTHTALHTWTVMAVFKRTVWDNAAWCEAESCSLTSLSRVYPGASSSPCPEHLTLKKPKRQSFQMPEPLQLAPFDMEEYQ